MSTCDRLGTIIDAVRNLITEQWLTNRGTRSEEIFDRDVRFIKFAAENVRKCSEEAMRNVLEEMRGLSHYFGSYCGDQRKLQTLLDSMFEEAQAALLVKRQDEKGLRT